MKWYAQMLMWAAAFMGLDENATEAEVHEATQNFQTREAMQAEIRAQVAAEMQSDMEALRTENGALAANNDQLQSRITELQTEISTQATRITELEALPVAKHTSGEKDTPSNEGKSWLNSPINQRAAEIRARHRS